MREHRVTFILFFCIFSLILGSRSSVIAQQPPSQNEKERGIEMYRKGDYEGAVKTLRAVVKEKATDSDAWYHLGLSLSLDGKINDASKAFDKTLSLRPDFAPGYVAMAYMRLLYGDHKNALKYAEKALALDPKNYESLYIAGSAHLGLNAAAEALASAEAAIKINPDYSPALILKTNALVSMFSEEKLKQNSAKGQSGGTQSPDNADAEKNRRSKYMLLKKASESLEAYLNSSRSKQRRLSGVSNWNHSAFTREWRPIQTRTNRSFPRPPHYVRRFYTGRRPVTRMPREMPVSRGQSL